MWNSQPHPDHLRSPSSSSHHTFRRPILALFRNNDIDSLYNHANRKELDVYLLALIERERGMVSKGKRLSGQNLLVITIVQPECLLTALPQTH